jgi:hypothetical protein
MPDLHERPDGEGLVVQLRSELAPRWGGVGAESAWQRNAEGAHDAFPSGGDVKVRYSARDSARASEAAWSFARSSLLGRYPEMPRRIADATLALDLGKRTD